MDEQDYPLWSDATVYAETLVVDQRHPAASDANAGTPAAPLRSIQAALDRVQAGERIRVHAGVYREMLQPLRGGTGPEAMIALEAAPGEAVVVRGSRLLKGPWSRPRVFDADFMATGRCPSMSQKAWLTCLGDDPSLGDCQAFALRNVEADDEQLMPWMEPVSGRPPFALARGMLIQDGQRLVQLHHHGDVPRVPGSFWVDQDSATLLVHPIGGIHPQDASFEVVLQPHLLCPQVVGLQYIAVRGITFEHCANSFLRAGAGAVTTRGGSYWMIEDCVFRQINSAGLEFGDRAFEWKDARPGEEARKWNGKGHVIVRRNRFRHCGTAGIRCLGATQARVLDNDIAECGWQDAEYYYECAGIKLLLTRHTLVAGNRIARLIGACGIWLDWDNQGSRVTGNLITDISSIQGGIFIEASLSPNRCDHNVIWNVDGPGIFGGDSSRQVYEHNIIGCTTAEAMNLYCHTDRTVNTQPVACVENLVCHNLFYNVSGQRCDEDANTFAGNVYVHPHSPQRDPWPQWQQRSLETGAQHLRGHMAYDPDNQRLSYDLEAADLPISVGPLALSSQQGTIRLGLPWLASPGD